MSSPLDRLQDLRLADLATFLAVRRSASITGAARELRVTPSQVSKAIARLEAQLHLTLLARGARGVSVTDAGQRLSPQIEELLGRVRRLQQPGAGESPPLTIAAPSFLSSLFLPSAVRAVPRLRVRGLELPPQLVRAYAAENFFDVALVVGEPLLPDTWLSEALGDIDKSLFASTALAARLGRGALTVERIRDVPFVSPVYNVSGQFVPADDDCPLRAEERRIGHEVQTLGMALELAATTEQLVFGPRIAARRFVDEGRLRELRVTGWRVSEPLHLVCHSDRVLAPVQRAIATALRDELARLSKSVK